MKINTTAYSYLNHQQFPQKFSEIVNAITSRPDVFSGCPLSASELEAMAQAMIDKTSLASDGCSRTDRNNRNIQRSLCESTLLLLSNFVLMKASLESTEIGKSSIVNLSKFTQSRTTRERVLELEPVTQVKGSFTQKEGTVLITWKKVKGAINYKVEKLFSNPAQPDAAWQLAGYTSRRKIILNELPPLSRCWIRVTACGYGELTGPTSNPVRVVIV